MKRRILLVDGHSVIFAWPDLAEIHRRNTASARENLVRRLTSLQDSSEWEVAVVFDGRGAKASNESQPSGIAVFYSQSGQPADEIIERLAAKYAASCEVTVATDDHMERTTVEALGGMSISTGQLLAEINSAETTLRNRIQNLGRKSPPTGR
ncbi:MAG: NYN domain-containing protein [Spartobacteria bacterium]